MFKAGTIPSVTLSSIDDPLLEKPKRYEPQVPECLLKPEFEDAFKEIWDKNQTTVEAVPQTYWDKIAQELKDD